MREPMSNAADFPLAGRCALVTGGGAGIGKAICDAFISKGVSVCTIDLLDNPFFVGDIADEQTLRAFASKVIAEHGMIDFLINNACLSRGGLKSCSYENFNYVLRVGISAPFLLTQLFMDHFNEPASVVNISSTRHLMSQADTESYTAAKGGITAVESSWVNGPAQGSSPWVYVGIGLLVLGLGGIFLGLGIRRLSKAANRTR